MRAIFELLRREARARIFFLTLTQSSLGTGAGYIALLLIATERFDSPWAVSLTLIADLVPAMLLGPLFGAAADRWSRKGCLIVADLLRAVAFAGIVLVDSFTATIAFATLAGVGSGLFKPAALAALPSVVDDARRTPAATSLYGVIADLGFTIGPALAGVFLILGGPETVLVVNVVTFALSALLLWRLSFGGRPERGLDEGPPPSLLRETREGLRATIGMRAIRIVIVSASAALFCGGLFNVSELFFALDDLGTSEAGFSTLVALFGLGFVCGSLVGSGGGEAWRLKRRYLLGLLAMGGGLVATGLTPTFALALATFAAAGFGNGLILVYERLLIQSQVDGRLHGRVFGIEDALASWAFAIAFLTAGGALSLVEPRTLILIAGAVGVVVWSVSVLALRREWRRDAEETVSGGGADAAVPKESALGQDGSDIVGGRRVGAE